MDLLRKIVLAVEDHQGAGTWGAHIATIDGYTKEQIGHHCYLLCSAGLADGIDATPRNGTVAYLIKHLTFAGHDFADASRNDTIWGRAKKMVTEKAGGAAFEVFKQVL